MCTLTRMRSTLFSRTHQTPRHTHRRHLHRARLGLPARRPGRRGPPPRRRRPFAGVPGRRPNHRPRPPRRRPGHHPGLRLPLGKRRLCPRRDDQWLGLCRPGPREHRAVRPQAHCPRARPARRRPRRPRDAGTINLGGRGARRGAATGLPHHAEIDGRWRRHGLAGVCGRGPTARGFFYGAVPRRRPLPKRGRVFGKVLPRRAPHRGAGLWQRPGQGGHPGRARV